MKKAVLFLLMLNSLFGLDLENECPQEIKKYPNAKNYVIRFSSYFDDYGCDLLSLYNILDKTDREYILDYIDDHPESLPDLIKLAKNKPQFLELLIKNGDFINFLKAINEDKNLFKNIYYLLQFVSIKKLKYNADYLKYIYFAAYEEETPQGAYKSFKQLKQIPIEFLNALIASYTSLKNTFPEIKKDEIVKDFIKLKYFLSYNQLKILCEYDNFYLTMFLYNTTKVNNFEEYQKEMIFIYKKLYDKYFYNPRLILGIIGDISPYLMTQNVPYNYIFKEVMNDLIYHDFLFALLESENKTVNPCNKDNYFGILGENNLENLMDFASKKNDIYKKYINDTDTYKGDNLLKVVNLFALSRLFEKYYVSDEWSMIEGILNSNLFPKQYLNLVLRVSLINKLESIGYFTTLAKKNDWNSFVRVDSDDLNSKNSKKYLYILFTSVEEQNSEPFIEVLNQNPQEAKIYLDKLANYSVEELSEHRFTLTEKVMHCVDTADNVFTTVEIGAMVALAPFTGGVSLAVGATVIAATKTVLKQVSKKVIKKTLINKVKKYSKKFVSKSLKKSVTKQLSKKLKNFNAEKILRNIEKKAGYASNTTGFFSMGAGLAALLLQNVYFKPVCEGE